MIELLANTAHNKPACSCGLTAWTSTHCRLTRGGCASARTETAARRRTTAARPGSGARIGSAASRRERAAVQARAALERSPSRTRPVRADSTRAASTAQTAASCTSRGFVESAGAEPEVLLDDHDANLVELAVDTNRSGRGHSSSPRSRTTLSGYQVAPARSSVPSALTCHAPKAMSGLRCDIMDCTDRRLEPSAHGSRRLSPRGSSRWRGPSPCHGTDTAYAPDCPQRRSRPGRTCR
jgi:hypothetical protein